MRSLALLPLVLTGCAARATGGYVQSFQDGSPAVLASLHADMAYFGTAVRTKWGPDLRSGALAVEVGVPGLPEFTGPLSLTAFGGVHLLQLDRARGDLSFGMGSPYLSAGPSLCEHRSKKGPDAIQCLSLLGEADYHVRFGSPDEGYWSVGLSYMLRAGGLD